MRDFNKLPTTVEFDDGPNAHEPCVHVTFPTLKYERGGVEHACRLTVRARWDLSSDADLPSTLTVDTEGSGYASHLPSASRFPYLRVAHNASVTLYGGRFATIPGTSIPLRPSPATGGYQSHRFAVRSTLTPNGREEFVAAALRAVSAAVADPAWKLFIAVTKMCVLVDAQTTAREAAEKLRREWFDAESTLAMLNGKVKDADAAVRTLRGIR